VRERPTLGTLPTPHSAFRTPTAFPSAYTFKVESVSLFYASSDPYMSHYPAKPQKRTTTGVDGHASESSPSDAEATGNRVGRLLRAIAAPLMQSERMRDLVSFQVSLVVHCILMLLLALVMLDVDETSIRTLLVGPELPQESPLDVLETPITASLFADAEMTLTPETTEPPELVEIPLPELFKPAGGVTTRPSEQVDEVPVNELLLASESPKGGGVEGRSAQDRARLAAERGGSRESERAVELGLAWLAAHQRQDGSWRLDHRGGPCRARCANPGSMETPIGATGLALLPFLGAGYTHLQGKHKDVVGDGIDFLKRSMKQSPHGGDLHWDTTVGMYAHGIATLVFCEAFAMTGDPSLRPYARDLVDFVCFAQGPRGGWRYRSGEPGDTTVTGWQVMALKSSQMAGIAVPAPVTDKAQRYLNTVQDGGGAFYGYKSPTKEPGPTAVGLLLRMYSGWTRQDERLRRGVAYLSYLGPSQQDMYFNYYATQVLHHYEGNDWEKWNRELREYLVETQATTGHEAGSWFFTDQHNIKAGRHYSTAMCTMILEVYYRYMPLYGERAVEVSDGR
jgi:hypothetical protein